MIRAVDNKRLDLSDEEYSYYLKLIEAFGKEDFSGLFSSDKNGQIVSITPPVDRQISLGSIFFILNVMMNQRLRAMGAAIENSKKSVAEQNRVTTLEERVAELESRLDDLNRGGVK